jgi:hypothetical protein
VKELVEKMKKGYVEAGKQIWEDAEKLGKEVKLIKKK